MSGTTDAIKYPCYLRIREAKTGNIVRSVGIKNLSDTSVQRVMSGILHNMNTDDFYLDDDEVVAAQEKR